jgi:ADP-heptose:LPS heptosyltransferase
LKIEKPIDILVQRRGAIGDVIMTTGVVRELKRRYGSNANIDVATDCAEVYRNNPHIRNIFPVDQIPGSTNWQMYINLDDAYEDNPENHYLDSYFYQAFGSTTLNQSVELFPTDADQAQVLEFRTSNDLLDKYIVIHMRRWNWEFKNISPSVWYSVFEKLFTERTDFKIVCVGGNTDLFVEHPLFVDARQIFNSQQIKHLCDTACAFVGVDSGPFHCAAASSTHVVALLTHLLPERIIPHRNYEIGKNCTAIKTLEDCAGCNDRQARPIRRIVCEKGTHPCKDNFDTDAITTAILNTL